MHEHLEIRALGGLVIERNGEPVTNFDARKVAALLVYLACSGRPHPREVLAEMLWEERTQSRASGNLRTALHSLDKTVGPFVTITRETVSIDPASDIWFDAAAFVAGLDAAGTDTNLLSEAVDLYGGDFLAGFYVDSSAFEAWATRERERLRLRLMNALDTLITCHLDAGDFPAGIARAMQMLHMDPFREKTHALLMQLYVLSGNRGKALEQYDVLCEGLHEEYGVTPSAATDLLYHEIRSGTLMPAIPVRPSSQPPAAPVVYTSSSPSAVLITDPHDIPTRAAHLIGRNALVADICASLAQNQRVLLQGFSGVGKTVLAAEVVARYIETRQIGASQPDAQPGPVLWLVTGQEDAPPLLEALARPFDAHQALVTAHGDERAQVVRSAIAKHGVRLVVFDNVWDGRVLQQLLHAIPAGIPILATSRYRLPVGKILTVPELNLEHAAALLSLHTFQDYSPDDADVRELCQFMGGHPFALEIAAKTMQVDELSPRELLDQVGGAPHLMVMPGWFADEGRESVKSLLDTSIDALDAAACEVFLAFGALFVSNATPELLALCMDRDPAAVAENLALLHRRGLAERLRFPGNNTLCYAVHDLAYCYARANVRLREEDVLRAVQTYIARHTKNLNALDSEIGNLMGAAQRAQNIRHNDALVAILRLLAVEAEYFLARGYSSQTLDLLNHAAQTARYNGQTAAAHHLFTKLGNAFMQYIEQFDHAFEAYSTALDLARLMQDHHREIMLLALLGTTCFRLGADDADIYYEQAYQLAKTHNDEQALGSILNHRSFYEGQKTPPDYERSWQFSDEAVQIARRHDRHQMHFASLMNRGNCERLLGRLDTALATHQEAFEMANQHDNNHWRASALRALGEDHHELGDREQAQRYFDESLALWRQTGSTPRADSLIGYMQEHGYRVESDVSALHE